MSNQDRAAAGLHDLIRDVRAALLTAEQDGPDASTVEALSRCVVALESSLGADQNLANPYDGFIDYTIDDEDFPSHFRQFDIRVYYRWEDYDRGDEPFATWGAQVERCEVLAVRYFDEVGNELSPREYELEEALNLVESRHQLVTDACTEDGYRKGVGHSHPLYSASPQAPQPTDRAAPRMAPSARTRTAPQDRRNFG